MKTIIVSARDWVSLSDFYKAILGALEAPEWHGHNVNALIDSIVYGNINGLEPPFRLDIIDMSALSSSLKTAVTTEVGYVLQARDEYGPFCETPDFDILLHDRVQ
jgi:hypothetical protein